MQSVADVRGPVSEAPKVRDMHLGANWFLWVSILSVFNTLIITFFNVGNVLIGLGTTRYVEATVGAAGGSQRWAAFAINLGLAGLLAAFGYLTRKGNDVAFILGMFLYFADAVVTLGYRDFFGFGFHLFALFFMFKGLLASRRRYDPSAE
jgi:hypothetical protein